MSSEKRIHYYGIDFLRAFSCIGIILMHIRSNTSYEITGFAYNTLIASFTQLVYLFIMISGFGMCTGYYNKVKNNTVDWNTFYTKRYQKIIPFFCFLLLIAITIEHNVPTLVEAFMEATLSFGLLPNNQLETIGVSWTLGVIFLFYMLFPFIVFLMYTRKRAMTTLLLSIAINYCCIYYFFSDKFVVEDFAFRHCFIYCLPFLLGGCVVYLFVDNILKIIKSYKWIFFILLLGTVILYYLIPNEVIGVNVFTLKNLVLCIVILSFAIGCNGKLCNNKIVAYLSSISMEMYLCQMVLFRVTEKAYLLYIFGNGWISYIFASIITIALIILFVECFRRGSKLLKKVAGGE